MSKHHTQRSRESQIEKVESLIIEYGGWNRIVKGKAQRDFGYLVARTLSCSFKKAMEYIDIITKASIAKSKFELWKDLDKGKGPNETSDI